MYIIGIDYGSGETTAAALNLDDSEKIVDLKMSNDTKIVSSMAKMPDGNWKIDPSFDTIQYVLEEGGVFHAYFKGPIIDGLNNGLKGISKEDRDVFGSFVKEVYQEILRSNEFLIASCKEKDGTETEANYKVYVACPSSWDEGQIKAYKQFLRDYEVPCEDVVSESRAAYISARDGILKDLSLKAQSGYDNQNEHGVLVIDYGSSTIDLTWFGDPNRDAITEGFQLGALNVEGVLYDFLINNEPKAQTAYDNSLKILKNDFILRALLKYNLRINKEEYYNALIKGGGRIRFKDAVCPAWLPYLDPFDVTPGYRFGFSNDFQNDIQNKIHYILCEYQPEKLSWKGMSYTGAILEELNKFKAKHPEVVDVSTILLTGGASVTDFFYDTVHTAFPNAEIHKDSQASYSISRGIAKYGAKKYFSDPKLKEIEECLDITWRRKDWSTCFLTKMITETTKAIFKDKMEQVLSSWKDGAIVADEGHTLQSYIGVLLNKLQEKPLAPEVVGMSQYDAYVRYANPLIKGQHSIHAFLRAIFDFLDDEKLLDGINSGILLEFCKYFNYKETDTEADDTTSQSCLDELRASLLEESFSEQFIKENNIYYTNKELEEINELRDSGSLENFGKLMLDYIKVYLRDVKDTAGFIDFEIPLSVSMTLSDDDRFSLFCDLLIRSFNNVQTLGAGGVLSSTLNKDRSLQNNAGPGRELLSRVFSMVIDEFTSKLVAEFRIEDIVKACQEKIEQSYQTVLKICELRTYTI